MNHLEPGYFFDLSAYAHAKLFERCTYAWQALAKIEGFLKDFQSDKKFKAPKGVYVENEDLIFIGKGTIIEPGAFLRGPCVIGDDCSIRHGAYIRGNFIAGNNCVIGHGTEVKNSIFLNGAHAAHFAYVGDSILGNNVNLGAGTVCANLKFDNSPIIISVEGSKVVTGLKKLGAIIGDDSQTGCNSVTNPGTLLGKHVFCYPSINLGGFIPSQRVVRTTEKMIVTPYSKG
jgi:NDP-sugar pyrophosphorylase family protein